MLGNQERYKYPTWLSLHFFHLFIYPPIDLSILLYTNYIPTYDKEKINSQQTGLVEVDSINQI